MTKKLTFEYVFNFFKDNNCELLDKIYTNNNTKMKYICKCKNVSKITFASFQIGTRCMKCTGSEKLTFEYVKTFFEKQSCKLLDKIYINTKTKMKYICKCKNESEIRFVDFQRGTRCRKCSGNEKLTFEYVKTFFEKQGCELLDKTYINNNTKMKYICKCKNESEIIFSNFQTGYKCMKCSGNEKLTFEYVKTFFENQGCELLDKIYKNAKTKMKYICKCKNESEIIFDSFQRGNRCNMCKNKTEKILYEWLKENYKNTNYQVKFDWCKNKTYLPFDFLLENYKLLFELDGMQHFQQISNWKSPEETQERDIYKMKLALQHGYSIIRICQEDVFNNTINWKELLKEAIEYIQEDNTCYVQYISKDTNLYDNYKSLIKKETN
jgi:very-short-patch-repair endonuclease